MNKPNMANIHRVPQYQILQQQIIINNKNIYNFNAMLLASFMYLQSKFYSLVAGLYNYRIIFSWK